jgi:hypothetical protein
VSPFFSRNVTHYLVMATLAEQASKLLDFDQKLDITLLDSIVGCMYSGAGEQVSLLTSQALLFHIFYCCFHFFPLVFLLLLCFRCYSNLT